MSNRAEHLRKLYLQSGQDSQSSNWMMNERYAGEKRIFGISKKAQRSTRHSGRLEIISSDRLVRLRQLTKVDALELFELIDRNRAHLSQFGDKTASKYPTLESIIASIVRPHDPRRLRFAIRNQQGFIVGSINLTPDQADQHQGEIGYYLGQEFTGQGYVTRAIDTLSDQAINGWGFHTLYGNVVAENVASIRALQRAGYNETGTHIDDQGYTTIELSLSAPIK